jgi:single-strand DNA-binding protein
MSINKVILLGNLGKDPEVRRFDTGAAVATFTLATSERGYTAKNGTQVPERTEWHNIVVWNGLAEVAEKFLRKGSKVYVEGKMRTRSYTDQANQVRYVTEINVENMEMLSPAQQQPTHPTPSSFDAPAQQPSSQPASPQQLMDSLPF